MKPIYWEINEDNTNEEVFLNYVKNLKAKLESILYPKYVICMDNLNSHKTPSLMKFYKDNKINIIFNAPYMSVFNSVELSFRYIKRILYANLFNNINEVSSKVGDLLKEEKFYNTLLYNYGETIVQYINFIEKNNSINLNSY